MFALFIFGAIAIAVGVLMLLASKKAQKGKGGVAMIRISGQDAIPIGERVFFPMSGKTLSALSHAHATYGEIRMPEGASVDDGLAVVYRAPRSFTGEDTVEITCHGGVLVTERVLSAVLAAGARAAEAGEFTRRSYLSGKMKDRQVIITTCEPSGIVGGKMIRVERGRYFS